MTTPNPFTEQRRFEACRQAAELLQKEAPQSHRFVAILDADGRLYTAGSVNLWQANAALASALAAMLDQQQLPQHPKV